MSLKNAVPATRELESKTSVPETGVRGGNPACASAYKKFCDVWIR